MRAMFMTFGMLTALGGHALQGQSLPQSPDSTLVTATPGYEFHIDLWANLHDYLYWRVQEDGPAHEGENCVSSQPSRDRAGWEGAEAYYLRELKDTHWRRGPVMRAMRYTLSGTAPQPDSMVTPVYERLREAVAVYRACFWERHQQLARERIADLLSLLIVQGPELKRRLERHYDAPWPSGVRVDVIPFASFAGANTASGPDVPPHMQISSLDPSLSGQSGLELLLHEASHEIFGSGRGLVGEAIDRVSRSLGVDPPRDLWHAVSFFTTGYVLSEFAAEQGTEYIPYWTRTGLAARVWPEFVGPIQEHWTRYLRGEAHPDIAMEGVVSAIIGAHRQP